MPAALSLNFARCEKGKVTIDRFKKMGWKISNEGSRWKNTQEE
jgi:hypothetical protein